MRYSRKEFVKKSAFGTASVALGAAGFPARSYRKIIGANERLSIALVGCGRRVPEYFDAIVKKNNNIRVAYICDVMKDRREKAAAGFSGSRVYACCHK